jgi:Mg2+ and Co2+ transporter CorA
VYLPREFHLLIDHAIAALDPLYALSPIFRFAAGSSNQALGRITRRYEIIASTLWDPKFSREYLNQLIPHKHILDDHACRHEEVLRYIQSPALTRWAKNDLTLEQKGEADRAKDAVVQDFEYLVKRYREHSEHHQSAIAILTSAAALAESRKQISLAAQVTKLTVLASVFLPLSFCTGLFGMNFVELERLSIWIWAVVTVCIGIVTLVAYGWDERERWMKPVEKVWGMWGRERKERIDNFV